MTTIGPYRVESHLNKINWVTHTHTSRTDYRLKYAQKCWIKERKDNRHSDARLDDLNKVWIKTSTHLQVFPPHFSFKFTSLLFKLGCSLLKSICKVKCYQTCHLLYKITPFIRYTFIYSILKTATISPLHSNV